MKCANFTYFGICGIITYVIITEPLLSVPILPDNMPHYKMHLLKCKLILTALLY